MKGYFACPLASGSDQDKGKAKAMVGFIEKMGHTILDRHVVAGYSGDDIIEEFCKNAGIKREGYCPVVVRRQDLDWVRESEFMVLDCTVGSWGGGIEFHEATKVRQLLFREPMPILCLKQRAAKWSYLILGAEDQFKKLWLREYGDLKEALNIIAEFFQPFFPK